jgi:hypothetical protein
MMNVRLTQPYGDVFKTQQALIYAARELSRVLSGVHPEADVLQLGATCMQIAIENMLKTKDQREVIRCWRECALGEKQIRLVTYRALRDGCINTNTYDEMFRLASIAARIREHERQSQRRRMQYLDVV